MTAFGDCLPECWGAIRVRNCSVEQHDGVLNAVLKMLAREIIFIQFTAGYTIDGLIKQFDWDSGNGQEGWPPMDGSHGIKIIDTEDLDIDYDDMSIKVKAVPQAA